MIHEILAGIGQFSIADHELFKNYTTRRSINRNEVLLKEGEICQAFYFIFSGSFFQYYTRDIDEIIIDLHLENEWMYNHQSLIDQIPSTTTIKTFQNAEFLELSLQKFHYLVSRSPAFLQFGKLFNQGQDRTYIFNNSLTPAERYEHINKSRPGLAKVFPVKMIASYLKIAPETLSRVRARN